MAQSTAIPTGSLILVTGVNGFIASHIADQFLVAGYRVRGTVRDQEKAKWITDLFTTRHGQGRFEASIVKDLAVEGAFDEAVKDCSGVVHVASNVSHSADPNEVIPPTVAGTRWILASAAASSSVKRFVYTSSCFALTLPQPDRRFHIDASLWNDDSVRRAWEPPPYDDSRATDVYAASKTEAERAAWKFVEEEKPGFVLNAVLPNYNMGAILHPNQPAASGAWIRGIWAGDEAKIEHMRRFTPQYMVDVTDDALLHVAAMIFSDVQNERLLAFAEPFNFNAILAVMRKIDPEHRLPQDVADTSQDLSTVDTAKSLELLRRMGKQAWTGMEESVRQNVFGA